MTNTPLLKIDNLAVTVEQTAILNDLSLTINPGEIHVIMGPNGCGKSSLTRTLIGDQTYEVLSGEIQFCGENLLEMEIEQRAAAGMFLSFQHPIALPGVSNIQFLKTTINHVRHQRGEQPMDAVTLLKDAKAAYQTVGLDPSFLTRPVNEGFSGGEKKRNELAQLLLLKPKLVLLDEIDSGLDVDALKIVAQCVNELRDSGTAFLVITHYQRLLNVISPDQVHLLQSGKIQQSGGVELALQIEAQGYQLTKAALSA